MTAPEDERAARLLRALRRRAGLRQTDVAALANVPREDLIRIERGDIGLIRLEHLRQVFGAVGASARMVFTWRGAAADRLLDERHAALVERALRRLERRGWRCEPEVSYSVFGERGSIDILLTWEDWQSAIVAEVKTELGSIEATNRVLDAKVRLAGRIVFERRNWRPAFVTRLLILADTSTNRRLIARHDRTMRAIYPVRGAELRTWLRRPHGDIGGLWFLSEVVGRDPTPDLLRQGSRFPTAGPK